MTYVPNEAYFAIPDDVAERDFSNFYSGDNTNELAGGLVPEVAAVYGLTLEGQADAAQIQLILDTMRNNKVLRDNPTIETMDQTTKLALVERSGVQKALDRSILNPLAKASVAATHYIIPSAVANWTDRATRVVLTAPKKPVIITAGSRLMDTATEVTNPNVHAITEHLGRAPSEKEYAARVVLPRLVEVGLDVHIPSFTTGKLDDIARELFVRYPELRRERLAVVTNANAGLIKAIQFRDAARSVDPSLDLDSSIRRDALAFDIDAAHPQMFAMTDSFPLAYTEEDQKKPAEYQKVDPAFGQMMLLPKKLRETFQSQFEAQVAVR